jgi:inner membrane protein involved in colicin E2 resistance
MPSYDDIEDEIENFFDDILENENDNESECKQTRDELMKIIQNVFKMDVKIENDIAYVKIYPETLDCTKKTIKIDFRNKQTNEKFSGNVQLNNISNYVNNYQLFEAIINFKKLI